MSGRVAAHAFAADQFQEALPGRYSTPGNVVRALRVLFLLSSDPSLAIQHPPLFVLAEFLAAATQSGSGTAAVPISSSAATPCDYALSFSFIVLSALQRFSPASDNEYVRYARA